MVVDPVGVLAFEMEVCAALAPQPQGIKVGSTNLAYDYASWILLVQPSMSYTEVR